MRNAAAIESTHPKRASILTEGNTMSDRRKAKTRLPQEIVWDIGSAVHHIAALAEHCGNLAGELPVVGNEDRQEAANEDRNAVIAMLAGIAALANEAARDIDGLDRHFSKAA